MHKLISLDVDLSKCQYCGFIIQKIDNKWIMIVEGKNCGKNNIDNFLPRFWASDWFS